MTDSTSELLTQEGIEDFYLLNSEGISTTLLSKKNSGKPLSSFLATDSTLFGWGRGGFELFGVFWDRRFPARMLEKKDAKTNGNGKV